MNAYQNNLKGVSFERVKIHFQGRDTFYDVWTPGKKKHEGSDFTIINGFSVRPVDERNPDGPSYLGHFPQLLALHSGKRVSLFYFPAETEGDEFALYRKGDSDFLVDLLKSGFRGHRDLSFPVGFSAGAFPLFKLASDPKATHSLAGAAINPMFDMRSCLDYFGPLASVIYAAYRIAANFSIRGYNIMAMTNAHNHPFALPKDPEIREMMSSRLKINTSSVKCLEEMNLGFFVADHNLIRRPVIISGKDDAVSRLKHQRHLKSLIETDQCLIPNMGHQFGINKESRDAVIELLIQSNLEQTGEYFHHPRH